ncbi:NUMOD3 domain-containing DNA-binding protein [Thalassotalea nanhaiensis]|uniref:NUMOD3 domain-containing DNA-binding protein n=1 Tax=Thalassotalea nanhaiensis TaxID=3065648 RepID=A0ABY9TFI7_9GAMM|nr:NUMOD3 domain-containing DNA-binding protein [Colwelliaceae bacterium SQ345]
MNQSTREKLSLALKGRKLSKSHVRNMRKALTGRKMTDETKAKMSESAKQRHAREKLIA